ncbi:MAG: hypothetical protein JRI46_01365 [Deltaproteobacteria bacterium]|nr:hypothetical protein [Deltaproteobacteria bacterium]
MTKKEFINAVANGKTDVLQVFLDTISQLGADYCVIGGLAVNAYAEPVVSLDLDIVVAAADIEAVCAAVTKHFKIERFAHSVNLSSSESDLRIQLQTDSRYQEFIRNATIINVLGYEMKVATVEDVLKGKIWAYSDEQRRMSKRQKDLADIARLVEVYPDLADKVPSEIRDRLR